ncbi:MAG: nucleotidyltransferase family protein [Bacteroidia bacterium]|nr:MAG: nucleotidyltransferase family protein [Bacteroidia bacterium]
MKAMIFAAGLGTRLGDISREMPKALVDINGRSALRIAAENLNKAGFEDLLVNIHHHPSLMMQEIDRLRSDGFNITVSDESEELLDTGGGLLKAQGFFNDGSFVCYNVDIFTDLNIRALYDYHVASAALATLAVRHRQGNRFLLVDRGRRVRGWCNNATKEEILTVGSRKGLEEIAFSGIQVVSPDIFGMMSEGIYSMTSLYLMLAGKNIINSFLHDEGYWFDCGTPRNLEKIRSFLTGSE